MMCLKDIMINDVDRHRKKNTGRSHSFVEYKKEKEKKERKMKAGREGN